MDTKNKKGMPPEEAKACLDKGNVVLIDVREPDEYAESHIPGAISIPLGTVAEATVAPHVPDKDSEVLAYCKGGTRSEAAVQKMREMGYTRVRNLGGIRDWPYEVTKD